MARSSSEVRNAEDEPRDELREMNKAKRVLSR